MDIMIRLVRAGWPPPGRHQDVKLTDRAYYEPPDGWVIVAIAHGEKGLPPWEDLAETPLPVGPEKPHLAEEIAAEIDPHPERDMPARYRSPKKGRGMSGQL